MSSIHTHIQNRIDVSEKRQRADVIIQHAKIADVFNLQWMEGNVVVKDGTIVAIDQSDQYEAHQIVDAKGKYVIPGFIDGHIHIESSLVPPSEFSRVLLPHGVTAVITDPHEIANVSGLEGIHFMLEDAKNAEMDIFVMLPSSVPATPFEHAGATLLAEDLQPLLAHPDVLGLAEVMDFPAVLSAEKTMLDKLVMAHEANKIIDGHGAGLQFDQIQTYRAAGIHTDHECVSKEEALHRIQQGMYVLIREGSAAKNLRELLQAVTPANARRFLFCTDDKHLDELMSEGSIDHSVRLAIQEGMDPLQAIQIASLNAAECYQLSQRGAIAPGFRADFSIADSLEALTIEAVWKDGEKVAENGQVLQHERPSLRLTESITKTVRIPKLTVKDFEIPFTNKGLAHVMHIIPNQLMTIKKVQQVPLNNGLFTQCTTQDLLKLAVIERHQQLGTIGLGIVHGFGLQKGAVATTVAHDSHNVIVLGTNDKDMLLATQALEQMQGGFVIVENGKILASLSLEIGGIMTTLSATETVEQLKQLHDVLFHLNPSLDFHLFLTLSFLSLPVIPELKLTDEGLFDVKAFKHIPLQVD